MNVINIRNNNLSCKALGLVLCALVGLGVNLSPFAVKGAQAQEASKRETRRTPALRVKVYDQLSRSQGLADEGKTAEAIEALDNVKSKASSMNSYELAMMYNFYGFVYYNVERFDEAIAAFEQVVEQQPIPESFELSTLFSLAQLHMMRGNYDKTVAFLERWETLNAAVNPNIEIPAKNYVLKAQAMYQQKSYAKAASYIDKAVALEEAKNDIPDENWYVLQRAVYYELKQPEKVKDILLKLVKHFDEPKYWLQLGGMYGELGEEKQQLAILETAYQQGYIQSGSDMFNLAQLYYYHQMPFKGARLIEKGFDSGALEKNLKNLKFLSQCWVLAKENDEAVPVMKAAADLSDDGELDAQLGQIFLNMEKWQQAIAASEAALSKGGLRNEGTVHLVKGMAFFNVGQYNEALNELAKAEAFKSSKGMAQQWSKFVETEKVSAEKLTVSLSR
ncbi:tetratricopeptide repeat protein [Paraglaciecola polaris]|uniref:tetratricopeptide repeat protein n=1 Tax=Paraglaciecola polaris TaxID=222814 RepID=UPI00058F84E0|nr:tetratricopeptide repeat protein [Paraglaciecola polaris]